MKAYCLTNYHTANKHVKNIDPVPSVNPYSVLDLVFDMHQSWSKVIVVYVKSIFYTSATFPLNQWFQKWGLRPEKRVPQLKKGYNKI